MRSVIARFGRAGGWVAVLAPTAAAAQSMLPSQITPPTFRPEPNRGVESRGFPAGPTLVVPPGADLVVRIRSVEVEGGLGELAPTTSEILKPWFGRRMSVAEMQGLALAIEAAYANAGYVLVRVGIPPQELKDGDTLRLVVVDGFIEDIDVAAVPDAVRAPVLGRVSALIGQKSIKLATIERHVMLAGEVSGVRLRSALARGKSEGGTRLILEAEHERLVGAIVADNRLSDTFGRWQVAASGVVNSALGWGEQGYATIGRDGSGLADPTEPWPMFVFAAGLVLPIGTDGFTLNPEFTRSLTRTPSIAFVPGTEGLMHRWSLRAAYPLIRQRAQTLDVRLSGEHIQQSIDTPDLDSRLSEDVYHVARGGADFSAALDGGLWVQFGVTLSQGLGGRTANDAAAEKIPLSQQHAGPQFTTLAFTGRLTRELPLGFRADAHVGGQTSFGDAVLRPEKFSLDGRRTLSPFESGSLYADTGATLRLELVRSLPEIAASVDFAGLVLEPYAFAAFGRGVLEAPTRVEPSSFEARARGIGLRAIGPDLQGWPRLRGEVELGYGETTIPYREDEWRLSVSVVTELK